MDGLGDMLGKKLGKKKKKAEPEEESYDSFSDLAAKLGVGEDDVSEVKGALKEFILECVDGGGDDDEDEDEDFE